MSSHLVRRVAVYGIIICLFLFLLAPLPGQELKSRATLRGHRGTVVSLAFSCDGKTLASGSADNSAKLWDVATGENTMTLKDAGSHGWCSVAISPDGKTLASGGGGNKVKLWSLAASITLIDRAQQYHHPLVLFSADGKTVVSGGICVRDIELWDVAARKKKAILKWNDAFGIEAIVLSPDGMTLGAAGHDGSIKLWDVATEQTTAAWNLCRSFRAAAFTLDAKRLAGAIRAVGNIDSANFPRERSITIWETATGKEWMTLKGNTADVSCVAFGRDGKTLASGNEDGTIRLWNLAKGKELGTVKGHANKVRSLAFSPDSKTLASGGEDKTIKVWDVPSIE